MALFVPVDIEADAVGALGRFVGRGDAGHTPILVADLVAVPERCGLVDPGPVLSSDARHILDSPELLFDGNQSRFKVRAACDASAKPEYLKLVVRQLVAGKLSLMRSPDAAASVFVVGKKDGALREIWNGNEVSEAAVCPPHPPMLANPSALAELEASVDRPLWISGRDAEAYFDQLLIRPAVQPFTGRPCVTLGELCDAGFPGGIGELARLVIDPARGTAPGDRVSPVSRVWPMGFGWSSFVAQSYMVDRVHGAGFASSQLLTEEWSLLEANDAMLSIATDDVIHYQRGTAEEISRIVEPPLQALDAEWSRRGLAGNSAKSFDLRPSAVSLGIELQDGLRLVARGRRTLDLVLAVTDMLRGATVSPRELSSVGGVLQWHNLLNRPLFSCLDEYYFSCAITTT
jgi:hypothetical protein